MLQPGQADISASGLALATEKNRVPKVVKALFRDCRSILYSPKAAFTPSANVSTSAACVEKHVIHRTSFSPSHV